MVRWTPHNRKLCKRISGWIPRSGWLSQSLAGELMPFPEGWLAIDRRDDLPVGVTVLVEEGPRDEALPTLIEAVIDHLVDVARLSRLGGKRLAASIQAKLPQQITTRSGDLGEIIACEYIEHHSPFSLPIKRLRWKDGRDVSMRGDDLIAIRQNAGGFVILKGETKSRQNLSTAAVEEAIDQLDQDAGRPQAHTIAFVADRLDEAGREEEAAFLYDLLTRGIADDELEHLLFTFSGNDPARFLAAVEDRRLPIRLTGLRIEDHQEFIVSVFEACDAAVS